MHLLLFIVLLISSCLPSFDDEDINKIRNKPILFLKQPFYKKKSSLEFSVILDADIVNHIDRYLVLKTVVNKASSENSQRIKTKFSFDGTRSKLKLKPAKDLTIKKTYGIYFKNKTSKPNLIYSFAVTNGSPKVLEHNLFNVASNQRVFSVKFNQPIILDNTLPLITLKNLTIKKDLDLTNFNVEQFGSLLIARLKKGYSLNSSNKYELTLGQAIKNHAGSSLKTKSFRFYVKEHPDIKEEPKAKLTKFPSGFKISLRHKASFTAQLNYRLRDKQEHREHLILKKTTMATLHKGMFYLSYIVSDLLPNKKYNIVVKVLSSLGKSYVYTANIETHSGFDVRFSKVLIDPINNNNEPDSHREYIGFKNISKNKIILTSLRISQEEKNNPAKVCDLLKGLPPITINAYQSFIIAGSNFMRESIGNNEMEIILTKNKTLCGGLANNKAKFMQIIDIDGNVIDTFNGFYSYPREGFFVLRKDIMGVDARNNYKYVKSTL